MGGLSLAGVRHWVVDECDRVARMGLLRDVQQLFPFLPRPPKDAQQPPMQVRARTRGRSLGWSSDTHSCVMHERLQQMLLEFRYHFVRGKRRHSAGKRFMLEARLRASRPSHELTAAPLLAPPRRSSWCLPP